MSNAQNQIALDAFFEEVVESDFGLQVALQQFLPVRSSELFTRAKVSRVLPTLVTVALREAKRTPRRRWQGNFPRALVDEFVSFGAASYLVDFLKTTNEQYRSKNNVPESTFVEAEKTSRALFALCTALGYFLGRRNQFEGPVRESWEKSLRDAFRSMAMLSAHACLESSAVPSAWRDLLLHWCSSLLYIRIVQKWLQGFSLPEGFVLKLVELAAQRKNGGAVSGSVSVASAAAYNFLHVLSFSTRYRSEIIAEFGYDLERSVTGGGSLPVLETKKPGGSGRPVRGQATGGDDRQESAATGPSDPRMSQSAGEVIPQYARGSAHHPEPFFRKLQPPKQSRLETTILSKRIQLISSLLWVDTKRSRQAGKEERSRSSSSNAATEAVEGGMVQREPSGAWEENEERVFQPLSTSPVAQSWADVEVTSSSGDDDDGDTSSSVSDNEDDDGTYDEGSYNYDVEDDCEDRKCSLFNFFVYEHGDKKALTNVLPRELQASEADSKTARLVRELLSLAKNALVRCNMPILRSLLRALANACFDNQRAKDTVLEDESHVRTLLGFLRNPSDSNSDSIRCAAANVICNVAFANPSVVAKGYDEEMLQCLAETFEKTESVAVAHRVLLAILALSWDHDGSQSPDGALLRKLIPPEVVGERLLRLKERSMRKQSMREALRPVLALCTALLAFAVPPVRIRRNRGGAPNANDRASAQHVGALADETLYLLPDIEADDPEDSEYLHSWSVALSVVFFSITFAENDCKKRRIVWMFVANLEFIAKTMWDGQPAALCFRLYMVLVWQNEDESRSDPIGDFDARDLVVDEPWSQDRSDAFIALCESGLRVSVAKRLAKSSLSVLHDGAVNTVLRVVAGAMEDGIPREGPEDGKAVIEILRPVLAPRVLRCLELLATHMNGILDEDEDVLYWVKAIASKEGWEEQHQMDGCVEDARESPGKWHEYSRASATVGAYGIEAPIGGGRWEDSFDRMADKAHGVLMSRLEEKVSAESDGTRRVFFHGTCAASASQIVFEGINLECDDMEARLSHDFGTSPAFYSTGDWNHAANHALHRAMSNLGRAGGAARRNEARETPAVVVFVQQHTNELAKCDTYDLGFPEPKEEWFKLVRASRRAQCMDKLVRKADSIDFVYGPISNVSGRAVKRLPQPKDIDQMAVKSEKACDVFDCMLNQVILFPPLAPLPDV